MFAVIESGGKQHTVSEGDQLKVELLPGEEGAAIEFDKVLMIRRPPRSTPLYSSAASDVYKRQFL